MKTLRTLSLLLLAGIAACGDDGPSEPNLERDVVVGSYVITTLTFDPQGSLPAYDIRARFGAQVAPQFIVSQNGTLQAFAQDPVTNQLVTANGSYSTTSDGIEVTFGNTPYANLLLSRRMRFTFNQTAGTLSFSGDVDDIARARLLQLVPELQNEQLLDPTPGRLTVTLTRQGTAP